MFRWSPKELDVIPIDSESRRLVESLGIPPFQRFAYLPHPQAVVEPASGRPYTAIASAPAPWSCLAIDPNGKVWLLGLESTRLFMNSSLGGFVRGVHLMVSLLPEIRAAEDSGDLEALEAVRKRLAKELEHIDPGCLEEKSWWTLELQSM